MQPFLFKLWELKETSLEFNEARTTNQLGYTVSKISSCVWHHHIMTLIFCSEFRVTLRLAVYRQSVHLGDNPLETHDQNFYFPTEHLRL
jgi:hypothetical protein